MALALRPLDGGDWPASGLGAEVEVGEALELIDELTRVAANGDARSAIIRIEPVADSRVRIDLEAGEGPC